MKFPYVYPDPESRQLRAALAIDSGLESDYILVGCGADELIDLIMRLKLNHLCLCLLVFKFDFFLSHNIFFIFWNILADVCWTPVIKL